MKKFNCEKLMFVVKVTLRGVFNKHCILTLFSLTPGFKSHMEGTTR